MKDIDKKRWQLAKLAWLSPVIGLGVGLLLSFLSNSSIGAILFYSSFLVGIIFTFLCLIYIKKYQNAFLHGLLGLITIILFLIVLIHLRRVISGRVMSNAEIENIKNF